jgi:hypothetical protein
MSKTYDTWTKKEVRFLNSLSEPIKIQNFLSRIEYDSDPRNSSPRWVIKERKAHCFEGAIFAAAALRHLGNRPLVLDLSAVNDDNHLIAIFKQYGYWGAIGKSNFTTLEFREPVYKTLRELAMSYFDLYFNILEELDYICINVDNARHYKLISRKMEKSLQKVSNRLLAGGLVDSKKGGLYKPGRN